MYYLLVLMLVILLVSIIEFVVGYANRNHINANNLWSDLTRINLIATLFMRLRNELIRKNLLYKINIRLYNFLKPGIFSVAIVHLY